MYGGWGSVILRKIWRLSSDWKGDQTTYQFCGMWMSFTFCPANHSHTFPPCSHLPSLAPSLVPPRYLAGSFWSGEETGLQQPEWQVTCVVGRPAGRHRHSEAVIGVVLRGHLITSLRMRLLIFWRRLKIIKLSRHTYITSVTWPSYRDGHT